MGVQFLMSQQKTGRRYQTLIRLGATYESLSSLPESSLRGLWDFLYWLQLSAVCLESERCLQGYSRPEPVGQCLKCCLMILFLAVFSNSSGYSLKRAIWENAGNCL